MTTTIRGSHGELTIDSTTGSVLGIIDENGNPVEYYGQNTEILPGEEAIKPEDSPVTVNIAEWRAFYGKTETQSENIDILDVGYTTAAGEAVPPVADWREEMIKAAADENYIPFHGRPEDEQEKKPVELVLPKPEKIRIAVIMDGGIIQNVLASTDVEIVVIDYDTDGAEPDDLTEIFPDAYGFLQTFPPELNSPDLETIFKVAAAEELK